MTIDENTRAAFPGGVHGVTGDEEPAPVLQCRLVCPECGGASVETMPTDACVYFHECPSCWTMLKPKPGDCCIFCSYGDQPCPPRQQGRPAP